MNLVSDITLIRTDTTLDLSQKAEKGMKLVMFDRRLYTLLLHPERQSIWDQRNIGFPSSATQRGGAPPCLPYSSLLRQSSLAFGAEVLVIFLSIFSFCALAATTDFTLLFGCQPSFQEFVGTNLTCLAFAFIHATRWIT